MSASLLLVALAGCASAPPAPEKSEGARVDALARAFTRFVQEHYAVRLAAESGQAAPPVSARLRARQDLVRALRDLGLDYPESLEDKVALKGALEAVRATLVARDFVFLPLAQGGETQDDDLGIALAHVRERQPARSQAFWGREVRYKLVLYEPLLREYPGWRARKLGIEGPVYSPGRFAGETVYVDHEALVQRAQALPPAYERLGLEGLIREVELRQAAYLLYLRDVPRTAVDDPGARATAFERLHERVLWTAVRHGDPDAALADVNGLASNDRAPPELRAAAGRVRSRLPAGVGELPGKAERAEALHRAADDAWRLLASSG